MDVSLFKYITSFLSKGDVANLSQSSKTFHKIVTLYNGNVIFINHFEWKRVFDGFTKDSRFSPEQQTAIKGEDAQVKIIVKNIIADPNFRLYAFEETKDLEIFSVPEIQENALSVYNKLFNQNYWTIRTGLENIDKFTKYSRVEFSLDLKDQNLWLVPNNIGNITNKIHKIYLNNNYITVMPENIGNIYPLYQINLQGNQSFYTPIGLSMILNLSSINIAGVFLNTIRMDILNCTLLSTILCDTNKLDKDSQDIIESIEEQRNNLILLQKKIQFEDALKNKN